LAKAKPAEAKKRKQKKKAKKIIVDFHGRKK
jgi:hypothetical protein